MQESGYSDEQTRRRDRLPTPSKQWAPILIAAGYCLIGVLWILFSDRALALITPSAEAYARGQTVKGWGYVLVTALFLYGILRLFTTRWQQIEDTLRASEEKYRVHFENVSDVIYSLDQEFRILSISPSVEDVLGYRPEALIGTPIQDLDLLTPASKQAALEDTHRLLTHGHWEPSIYEFIAKDGTTKLGEVSSAPLIRDGELVSVVSVARDVTERIEMERRLHRQERLAAVGQLAAGIAHDFRNLMTTISLYAEMGLRQPGVSRELARKLRIIIGESHKATDLVQQMLDFSADVAINTRPLNLADHVREVATILRRTIPESIRVSVTTGSDPIMVRADPGRIQQALTNLALNARDAMPKGGDLAFEVDTLTLRAGDPPPVTAMALGAWARMSIKDSGMGMTEEVQDHLFEPFYTTKQAGQGTGLGLAQVYGIVVRQHQGAIDVESEVDQGTTVRIYLPLTGDTEAELAHPQLEVPQGRGETILLVEDQTELREAVSSLLRSLGYQVHQAPDGTEALRRYEAALQQGGIDLVVSDLVMPEMSGRTLARALRELDPEVKLLAITGYPLGDVMDELRAVGFLDVVHKPLDADAFARSVRDALDAPSVRPSERQRGA